MTVCTLMSAVLPRAATADSGQRSLIIAPGREFAADSYVHKPLPDDAPLDPKSPIYVARLQKLIVTHYGHADVNIDGGSPPIYLAAADQPTVRVRYIDWDSPGSSFTPLQTQWEAVPLPADFRPSAGTDEEAVVYQPATGRMWEFWAMRKTGATTRDSRGSLVEEWGAKWGGRMDDIASNPGHWVTTPEGYKFGATASGIPFLAGIMTIEELRSGQIEHVLGLSLPEILAERWSPPAQRTDGSASDPDAVPEGAIFRLPAALDLDAIDMDPFARMVARAVQRHGLVIWDFAGVVGFRAENPAGQYPAGHPYWKEGGILRCPAEVEGRGAASQLIYGCWPPARLRGFPWDKLQVLQLRLSR
jgi:hypothetical protein